MLSLVVVQIWDNLISDSVRGSRCLVCVVQLQFLKVHTDLILCFSLSLAVLWAGWDRPMEDDYCHGAQRPRINVDQNSILLRLGRSPIQHALIYAKRPSSSFKRRRVVNKRQQLG